MSNLLHKRCAPCSKETPPLTLAQAQTLASELKDWKIVDGKTLRREFVMKDFMAAVRFISRIAEAAEAEDHHPDLHLTGYRRLAIELSTHAICGLSENDFILAAKIDALPRELKA